MLSLVDSQGITIQDTGLNTINVEFSQLAGIEDYEASYYIVVATSGHLAISITKCGLHHMDRKQAQNIVYYGSAPCHEPRCNSKVAINMSRIDPSLQMTKVELHVGVGALVRRAGTNVEYVVHYKNEHIKMQVSYDVKGESLKSNKYMIITFMAALFVFAFLYYHLRRRFILRSMGYIDHEIRA
jgi:hypothetical protein